MIKYKKLLQQHKKLLILAPVLLIAGIFIVNMGGVQFLLPDEIATLKLRINPTTAEKTDTVEVRAYATITNPYYATADARGYLKQVTVYIDGTIVHNAEEAARSASYVGYFSMSNKALGDHTVRICPASDMQT